MGQNQMGGTYNGVICGAFLQFLFLFTISYLVFPTVSFSVGPASCFCCFSPLSSHYYCQLIERTWFSFHHHLLPPHAPASHLQSRSVFQARLNKPSSLDRCRPVTLSSSPSPPVISSQLASPLGPPPTAPCFNLPQSPSPTSLSSLSLLSSPSVSPSAPRLRLSRAPPRSPEYPRPQVSPSSPSCFPVPGVCLPTPLFPLFSINLFVSSAFESVLFPA
ncbi:vegetative cell wall protein gp1-like [Sander lucioperca]|uniref:vegetative cell wall protein gp1-like n=1 Tax=Sander lucioperca TaxID=283035 RepID=UPI00125DA10F|nr:vegetative cell wall protein gp1-like [Sander lucioperca]